MIQRHTPLKRTPLKKQSKKRAKESRIYLEKRKTFLEANPVCQIWLDLDFAYIRRNTPILPAATDIHHKAGRIGKNYLDESTWMAVSREGHDWIHDHPKEAREKGYLV